MMTTPETDATALSAWLSTEGLVEAGSDLELLMIEGGQSNITYRVKVRTDAGERVPYVVRRPPFGGVLATAHSMSREWAFLAGLHGTGVPVPRPVRLCEDDAVIGAPFYVMEFVPGVVLHERSDADALPEAARAAASHDLASALAALHNLDPAAVGLEEIGRPQEYVARQLARWQRQWEQTRERSGLQLPEIDAAHDSLAKEIPAQVRSSIVHGDVRLGNVIVAPSGAIRGLLDWELATLGDPRADLGWLLLSWDHLGEKRVERPTGPAASAAAGFGTRESLVATYANLAGDSAVAELEYFVAFAAWRWACISAGVYARYQAGHMGGRAADLSAIERAVRSHATFALETLARR